MHLRRYWYVACLSSELSRKPLARTVLDVPMALFRAADTAFGPAADTAFGPAAGGHPVALLDRCPHRNVPLSLGRVRDGQLECRYHGWRFGRDGTCMAVPGLCAGTADRAARRATAFPARERDGFVWVFPTAGEAPGLEPPGFAHAGDPDYVTVRRSLRVPATLHAALENTLDVPHTAFLHQGLFRGGRDPVEIEVIVRRRTDRVEAEYLGEPRPPGIIGKILAPSGGVVTHFDRFVLPSRAEVEYRLGRHHLVVTTAFTPVSETDTRLHVAVTFRGALPATLVRAVLTPIANRVFAQDAMILRAQADNVARFGGEAFASTELDVLGNHIRRLLRQAESGETGPAEESEHRIRMRV